MLKEREERVVAKDGIHHRRRIYFASELCGLAGMRVEIAFMPHDLRTVDVYHEGRFLATAAAQQGLTEEQRRAALARRRADAAAIRRRAAKACRAARLRIAPITTPGEIDELAAPPRPEPTPDPGVLRLLGREGAAQPRPRGSWDNVKAPHHLGLPGARMIETRELQLAEQAVSDLLALEAMGVIYGPAGSGETFAAALAATQTQSTPGSRHRIGAWCSTSTILTRRCRVRLSGISSGWSRASPSAAVTWGLTPISGAG